LQSNTSQHFFKNIQTLGTNPKISLFENDYNNHFVFCKLRKKEKNIFNYFIVFNR